MKYILASQSPRRIELMNYLVKEFDVKVASIDEKTITHYLLKDESFPYTTNIADELVKTLAQEKATAIHLKDFVIIGSDTLVYSPTLGMLGKPKDSLEAEKMLVALSKEQIHTVHTGVCIRYQNQLITFSTQAQVQFQPYNSLQHQLILDYIHSGSPFDKAGGYSIGDQGSLLIQGIKGDYYTILGFPISEIYRQLKKANLL